MGLAVSRKVGRAVARNRVKRVLREFFRLHQALVPPATDIVVVPKRQLRPETLTLSLVCRDLLPLLGEVRRRVLSANSGARA